MSDLKRKARDLAGPGMGSYDRLGLAPNYQSVLNPRDTQKAFHLIKSVLMSQLCEALNLEPVNVPLVVTQKSGVNDTLDRDGSRLPVSFEMANDGEHPVSAGVVQAATKWKRTALKQFGFEPGSGLITDMKAVRSGYFLDQDHSCTVTQFDWERAIERADRNMATLRRTVEIIWLALKEAEKAVRDAFPALAAARAPTLPDQLHFIQAEELLAKYPDLPRKERETAILKELGAVFLLGIGHNLADGLPHELRAVDYDDWITPVTDPTSKKTYHGLNGDILVWNPVTGRRHELTSMGVRVDADELQQQLAYCGQEHLASQPYHQQLLAGEFPSAIGGGLGVERIVMLFLQKAHIGEVQVSPWPDVMYELAEKHNIHLLK